MNIFQLQNTLSETPEGHYDRFNFQRRSQLAEMVEILAADHGPAVLLAGAPTSGRGYFCNAACFLAARDRQLEVAVWHLNLEGFEPELPSCLLAFVAHLAEDYALNHRQRQDHTLERLQVLAARLPATDWSAAILSLLSEFEQPLQHFLSFDRLAALANETSSDTSEPENEQGRQVLHGLLTALTHKQRVLIHSSEASALRPLYRRWLGAQAERLPNLSLALACRSDHRDEDVLPAEHLHRPLKRFDFQPLNQAETQAALSEKFEGERCPQALADALHRYSQGSPAILALATCDLLSRGELQQDASGSWSLLAADSVPPSLEGSFANHAYAPIAGLIEDTPELGPVLAEFLLLAALCGRNVPADILLEKLALSEEDADNLLDILDDQLVEELAIFWDLEFRHAPFPGLTTYRFRHPLMPSILLARLSDTQREMEAAALLPFFKERLPVRTRGIARLLLAAAQPLDEADAAPYRRQLEWWIGPDEVTELQAAVEAQVAEASIDTEWLLQFVNQAEHWPPYRRLAIIEAVIAALSLDAREPMSELPHELVVGVHMLRCHLLLISARAAEAVPAAKTILELAQPDSMEQIQALSVASWAHRDAGDLEKSKQLAEQCLEACEALLDENDLTIALALTHLSHTLYAQGDFAAAQISQTRLVEVQRRVLGEDHPHTLVSLSRLAQICFVQKDLPKARHYLETAATQCQQTFGHEHPETLKTLHNLASTILAQGQMADARTLLEEILPLTQAVLGPAHPGTLKTMASLVEALQAQGNQAAADELQALISSLQENTPSQS